MAAGFVGAVAADGEVRMPGQGRQQIEQAGSVRRPHLGAIALRIRRPVAVANDRPAELERARAGRQLRQPHVVPVLPGILGLLHAAGRATDRADAQALAGKPRAAEPDDADTHAAGTPPESIAGLGQTYRQLCTTAPPCVWLLKTSALRPPSRS